MDISSPEKSTGEFNKEYDASLSDRTDINAFEKKEEFVVGSLEYEIEMPRDEREIHLNTCYTTPSMPLCVVNEEGAQSPLKKSKSMGSSLPLTSPEEMTGEIDPNPGISIVQSKTPDCGIDGEGNTIKDDQKDAVLDADVDADVDADATVYSFEETECPNFHLSNPSDQRDNDHYNSMDRESNEKHDEKNTALDEVVNGDDGNLPLNSQLEKIEVYEETNYKNSNLKTIHDVQVREGCYSNTAPPENDEMVWQPSSLQSPQETQNVSPPERQLSVSAERFPHKQSPPKSPTFLREEMSSPSKQVPSPRSSRRRYSPSPEKNSSELGRASSRERSFPSTRRKSPDQVSKREAHKRDDSPRKHLSQSPQKRDSPRRGGGSPSNSPMRRRHSPRSQRSHRHSRSRSPIAREHNRRSPRKRSPRRRSPPTYHSGRRSPGRRWSPPSNRNTGIGKPGKNLYVAGFSYGTTERDLERKFSKFGRVTDVRVVRDRRTGDSRGFGFLSLERDEDADAAIRAVDQAEWNGRIILVEKSKSSSRRN